MDEILLDKAITKIDEKNFAAVVAFGKHAEIIRINKHQRIFLSRFFETGDFATACSMAGVQQGTALGWMRNKKFMAFIKERMEFYAKSIGFDVIRWNARMWDIWEGRVKADKNALKAGELIGKALGVFVERRIHEFGDDNVELAFTFQKTNNAGNPIEPAPSAGTSGLLGQPSSPPNGWEAFRKDPVSLSKTDPSQRQTQQP